MWRALTATTAASAAVTTARVATRVASAAPIGSRLHATFAAIAAPVRPFASSPRMAPLTRVAKRTAGAAPSTPNQPSQRISAARPFSLSGAQHVHRFFSHSARAFAIAPSPASSAAASGATATAPHLFDASHLMLSNLEEKRETLPFLEVSADGGHHRDVSFSRAELSHMLELHPRDLRFLDASMRNLPSILARKKVIIVNLEMFKALITADRVLMSDTWYPHVKEVVAPMQASVLNGGELYDGQPVPFEFIALEHILLTVCRNLEARFDVYLRSLGPLLESQTASASPSSSLPSISMLTSSTPPESSSASAAATQQPNQSNTAFNSSTKLNALVADGSGSTLMHLLQLKNGLTNFEVTLRETGGALRDLLETDEDMAHMYLTLKSRGYPPAISDHGEVEVILETYLRKVDELENEVEQMVKSITLTEEHIQIRLDSTRNSMMKLELLTSIGTFGVTSAALGAALFGMNLRSGLETTPGAFLGATALFLMLASLLIRKGVSICRKRNIHLFQIDSPEPMLSFPHFDPYAASIKGGAGDMPAGSMKGSSRRMAKMASLQSRNSSGAVTLEHQRAEALGFGSSSKPQ